MPNSIKTYSPSWSNSGISAQTLSPISIHNLNSYGNVTSASMNWNDLGLNMNPSVKKYEVVETTEDIVALSVAAHREFKENSIHYKLLDASLFNKVTSEDREHAKTIKDYYSKKSNDDEIKVRKNSVIIS